jgi:BirA family transcriptional regulator, biotin operon repressor / biotin---[acetyl-CoA-carboxylase] ligase
VESTNNYAMAKLHAGMLSGAYCFFALEQTAGKGQRGKSWVSLAGQNITMSTAFSLSHSVSANVSAFPFLLSASMALGCYDFIKDYGIPDVSIKWPNDIYSGDRKAAGILIENGYKGATWHWSVVGTGVNVNQQQFPEDVPNAVSFKMITGNDFNVIQLGKRLHHHLVSRFEVLYSADKDRILEEYNSKLYKKGEQVTVKKDNAVFAVRIDHVTADGELVTYAGMEMKFKSGEVEFIHSP